MSIEGFEICDQGSSFTSSEEDGAKSPTQYKHRSGKSQKQRDATNRKNGDTQNKRANQSKRARAYL